LAARRNSGFLCFGFCGELFLGADGKLERWHKSLKSECIRPGTPLSLDDARRLLNGYVEHSNNIRLNSAIGYVTPRDTLAGHQREIHTERERKLAAARRQRRLRRQQAASLQANLCSGDWHMPIRRSRVGLGFY
jgi:hypothetical protein